MSFLSIERCRGALVVAAAVYLALLPSNALSFWRSLAFATATALTVALIVAQVRDRRAPRAMPGLAVPMALVAWAGWALASLAWSIDPAFTLAELKSDVLWGLCTVAIFYAASATVAGFRVVSGAALAGLAFWPALALGLDLSTAGWNARHAHMGVVAYSTYLVTLAPLLLLLMWAPPLGFRAQPLAPYVAALLFGLVLITARMSENRIVWIALATSILVLAVTLRPARSPVRVAIVAGALLVGFLLLFADSARQRATNNFASDTSVAATFAADPRLAIWKHATKHIAERPWHGYGYGRLILREELRADTGDRLLTHAHNVFVSQWLQIGGVGVALLIALFATLAVRYARMVRSADLGLARLGAVGLAVLAAFVVKNLTDDFFFRANAKLFFAVNAMLLGVSAGAMSTHDETRGRRIETIGPG